MAEEVQLQVEADDPADLELLREIAEAEEGINLDQPDSPGRDIAPILILILVGTGAAVLSALVKWITRKGKHGLVIDIREFGEDRIKVDKDLDYGQMVVITLGEDGKSVKVEITTYDPDNDFTAISKLIFEKLADGVVKPLKTVTDVLKGVVGDKAKVEVKPAG